MPQILMMASLQYFWLYVVKHGRSSYSFKREASTGIADSDGLLLALPNRAARNFAALANAR